MSCLCVHQAYESVGSSVWFCSSWEDFGRFWLRGEMHRHEDTSLSSQCGAGFSYSHCWQISNSSICMGASRRPLQLLCCVWWAFYTAEQGMMKPGLEACGKLQRISPSAFIHLCVSMKESTSEGRTVPFPLKPAWLIKVCRPQFRIRQVLVDLILLISPKFPLISAV